MRRLWALVLLLAAAGCTTGGLYPPRISDPLDLPGDAAGRARSLATQARCAGGDALEQPGRARSCRDPEEWPARARADAQALAAFEPSEEDGPAAATGRAAVPFGLLASAAGDFPHSLAAAKPGSASGAVLARQDKHPYFALGAFRLAPDPLQARGGMNGRRIILWQPLWPLGQLELGPSPPGSETGALLHSLTDSTINTLLDRNGSASPVWNGTSPGTRRAEKAIQTTGLFGTGYLDNFHMNTEFSYSDGYIGGPSGDTRIRIVGYLGTLYYDFETGTNWKPFVGLGIGRALILVEGKELDGEDNVFVFQARAGLTYELTPALRTELAFRFFDAGEPLFHAADGRPYRPDYRNQSVEFTLTLKF